MVFNLERLVRDLWGGGEGDNNAHAIQRVLSWKSATTAVQPAVVLVSNINSFFFVCCLEHMRAGIPGQKCIPLTYKTLLAELALRLQRVW